MSSTYDYIIVGGGPSGLFTAWMLANYNKKVVIIERELTLGGCHRVRRVGKEDYFTEHGPRVYSNAYRTTISLLKEMGIEWDDYFTEYDFSLSKIGGKTFLDIPLSEKLTFITTFLSFTFSSEFSKGITVLQFMKSKEFSNKTIDYIDRLCRLTDGAGADRYTLFEFLQLINQNGFYKLYQPLLPNDSGLFPVIKDKLLSTGNVTIFTGTEVEYVDNNGVNIKGSKIDGKRIILAIPPEHIIQLMTRSSFSIPMDYYKFEKSTRYETYIPVSYSYYSKIQLPKVWGFPQSDWGIAFIILSDYMSFHNFGTVISSCITKVEAVSTYLNKTPHECTENELKDEIFRQLSEAFPSLLPSPDVSILSPGVYYDQENRKYKTNDSSFIRSVINKNGDNTIPMKLTNNIYTLGTHLLKHTYEFTSMESAVQNSVALVHDLIPQAKNKYHIISPHEITSLIKLIFLILFVILLWIIYSCIKKKSKITNNRK